MDAATGQMQIASNQVTGRASQGRWTGSEFGADQECFVEIPTLPLNGAGPVYVFCRMTSAASSGYSADWRVTGGVGTMRILRHDASVGTDLGQLAVALTDGDAIMCRCTGRLIVAFARISGTWQYVLEALDSTYVRAGYIGVGFNSNAVAIDNFGGGTYMPARSPALDYDYSR